MRQKLKTTRLLITVCKPVEVEAAIEGGADIIDVKDPRYGSLGPPDYATLCEVVKAVGNRREVSMALGDIKEPTPLLSHAAYVASSMEVLYLKIGLETADLQKIKEIYECVLSGITGDEKVILVGYADYTRIGSINPLLLPRTAYKLGAYGVMIDTRIKDGRNTFQYLTKKHLTRFVNESHELGLLAAIAGGLSVEHVPLAVELGFDVIGFRGAVCGGDRLGLVDKAKVLQLRHALDKCLKTNTTH